MKVDIFSDSFSKILLRLKASTFEGACSYPNDLVHDTVPQRESSLFAKSCSKSKPPKRKTCSVEHFIEPKQRKRFNESEDAVKPEDYENIMVSSKKRILTEQDYAADDCMQSFIEGQFARMVEMYHLMRGRRYSLTSPRQMQCVFSF
jgi:hypothetical protein